MTSAQTVTALLSIAALAGCTVSPAAAEDTAGALQAAAAPGAGNLPTTAAPDRGAEAIAALRARGDEGLRQILAEYDRAPPQARAALAATVDAVAAQRYATVSRLYWHTDLGSAKREAERTGRPILALRMLGRLDEDLSCANSRFFRTALYSDHRVARLLRESFVLLWTSERPVPRVTIDYGDGRVLQGTVTGNSIHYVLDAEGEVVDALPGLYIPQVFVDELSALQRELAQERAEHVTSGSKLLRRAKKMAARQQRARAALSQISGAIWVPNLRRLLTADDAVSAVERAQRATAGKARVEVPLLHQIAPGTNPGSIDDSEVAQWASIGQVLFGLGEIRAPQQAASAGAPAMERRRARVARGERRVAPAAPVVPVAPAAVRPGAETPEAPEAPEVPEVLDATARALVTAVYLGGQAAPGVAAAPEAVLARFEQRMVADTAISQVRLRPRIWHQMQSERQPLDELNLWVYDALFSTPRQDPWLGLLPRDEYTGLPGDGVVAR